MSDLHPFTGFGDDTNSSVKFAPLLTGDAFPDWTGGEPRMAQRPVVLSSRTVTQVWGRDPYEITFRAEFATRAAFEVMRGLVGQRATLRYIDGVTSRLDGDVESGMGGVLYLTFPETMLLAIANVEIFPDGVREANLTFQRAADLDTYVGFPSTGEDEA